MVSKVMKNDEGVSAVIGVILMVAITVILAAVIAAFVFSMSNNVGTSYTVAFTAKKMSSGEIIVTNNGGADVNKLDKVMITVQPNNGAAAGPINVYDNLQTLNNTGSTYTIAKTGNGLNAARDPASWTLSYPNHVIVTGTFKDGSSQVLIATDI